jgi:glycerophosphoryl diester phosphodiesterase
VSVFTDTPVLCGHRGGGRGSDENTLASFLAAAAAGVRWLEVDARLTADGVLVARHDPVIEDGRFVADLTAAETGLMPVADLLAELPGDVALDVDVKSSLEDALRPRERTTAAHAADLLAGESRRLLVTSFDPAALLIVRERAPALALGLLTWTRFPLRKAIAAAAQLGLEVVVASVESFDANERDAAESVRVAHEAGLQVAAWCPAPDERDALIEAGVDCLVVDEVAAALTGSSPASGRGPRPSE